MLFLMLMKQLSSVQTQGLRGRSLFVAFRTINRRCWSFGPRRGWRCRAGCELL